LIDKHAKALCSDYYDFSIPSPAFETLPNSFAIKIHLSRLCHKTFTFLITDKHQNENYLHKLSGDSGFRSHGNVESMAETGRILKEVAKIEVKEGDGNSSGEGEINGFSSFFRVLSEVFYEVLEREGNL
jgi:hypothetical protein